MNDKLASVVFLFSFFSGPVPTFPHFDSELCLTLTFATRLFILLPCISVYLLSDSCQLFTCLPCAPTDQSIEKVIGHAGGIGNQELRMLFPFLIQPFGWGSYCEPKLLFQTTLIFCLSPVKHGSAFAKGLSIARGQLMGHKPVGLSHLTHFQKKVSFN